MPPPFIRKTDFIDTYMAADVNELQVTLEDHETRLDDLEATPPGGGSGFYASGFDLPGALVFYTVSTATALRTRIDAAVPGDVIGLTAGTYDFTTTLRADNQGTIVAPIYVVGLEPGVVIRGPDMTTNTQLLAVQADYWRFYNFEMTRCHILVWNWRGSNNVYRGLHLHHSGGSLLHLKGLSRHNLVEGCVLHDTRQNPAISQPSEAVYVGTTKAQWASTFSSFGFHNGTGNAADPDDSSFNIVRRNLIYNTYTENIEFKEGTVGNVATENTLDGTGIRTDATSEQTNINCKGNYCKIFHNRIVRPAKDAIKFSAADDNTGTWGSHNWCGPNSYDFTAPAVAGGVKVTQNATFNTNNRVHPLQQVIAGTDPGLGGGLVVEGNATYEVG